MQIAIPITVQIAGNEPPTPGKIAPEAASQLGVSNGNLWFSFLVGFSQLQVQRLECLLGKLVPGP